jgi:hypothetical protein
LAAVHPKRAGKVRDIGKAAELIVEVRAYGVPE